MGFHAVDTDRGNFAQLHSEHFAALQNQRAVAFRGKALIFEFFHKAFDFQIGDPAGTHSCAGLNDAGQLVHREQALFQICFRFDVGTDPVAVAENGANVLFRNALCAQRLRRMLQMLLRELFVIIVMQHSDRLPVLRRFAEMLRHGAHGITDILFVQQQRFFADHCAVQFSCFFQCQHDDPPVIRF